MILFDPDKAAHLMKQSGVDLLLPHTLLNAGYLADHWYHLVNTTVGPYTTFDVDETYQLLVGLPCDRKIEPFVTCRRGAEEGEMYVWDVWIKDKRIWGPNVLPRSGNSPLGPPATNLYPDPYQAAAAALQERKLDAAVIGVEQTFLSVNMFDKLRRALPRAEFRDVSSLFLELRAVKTEEEIRRLRRVAQATQGALAAAIKSLRPACTPTPLGIGWVPVASVPIRLPCTRAPLLPSMAQLRPEMRLPEITELSPARIPLARGC